MTAKVTHVWIIIPPEKQPSLLSRLKSRLADADTTSQIGARPATALSILLQQWQWQVTWSDEYLFLTGYQRNHLDIEHDPVLESAVGCALPGSFLQGYSDNNVQWQVRYSESGRRLVLGEAIFPRDPAWDQQSRSLLLIREATPDDLGALSALSPAVRLERGSILLAEHAGKVQAFLQYHPSGEVETAVLTHLATRVNGRHNGYPQRLVQTLQSRYRGLVALATRPMHRRIYRVLGFVQIEQTHRFIWLRPGSQILSPESQELDHLTREE